MFNVGFRITYGEDEEEVVAYEKYDGSTMYEGSLVCKKPGNCNFLPDINILSFNTCNHKLGPIF